jgi:hypothetical protein
MRERNPTLHELRAALFVAGLIDSNGNSVDAARESYQQAATGGTFSGGSLLLGERLLVAAGVLVAHGMALFPTPSLMVLAALDAEEALLALASAFGDEAIGAVLGVAAGELADRNDAQAIRDAFGAAGEEAVVAACRSELVDRGRDDLAEGVQRVSLLSDAFGYDVAAPDLDRSLRLLEVKTEGAAQSLHVRFFLSRHEFEVGRRRPGWALVCCRAPRGPDGPVEVVGWCRASDLREFLPEDRRGRWTEALVRVPQRLLHPGLPPVTR